MKQSGDYVYILKAEATDLLMENAIGKKKNIFYLVNWNEECLLYSIGMIMKDAGLQKHVWTF